MTRKMMEVLEENRIGHRTDLLHHLSIHDRAITPIEIDRKNNEQTQPRNNKK